VSSAPAPQFDPIEPVENAEALVELAADPPAKEAPQEELEHTESAEVQPYEYIGVIHLTRTWVQYGIFGFAVLCIVIGAVEALFGR
jgi:hypothetical protein